MSAKAGGEGPEGAFRRLMPEGCALIVKTFLWVRTVQGPETQQLDRPRAAPNQSRPVRASGNGAGFGAVFGTGRSGEGLGWGRKLTLRLECDIPIVTKPFPALAKRHKPGDT